jgi:hypothetical protein
MGAEEFMNAPDKIYGWLDTQLSIARFYGGITFRGHQYVIDMADPEQPLVRKDLFKANTTKKPKKKLTPADQMDLLDDFLKGDA